MNKSVTLDRQNHNIKRVVVTFCNNNLELYLKQNIGTPRKIKKTKYSVF